MTTLQDKAMTVELRISKWTARKHDRGVSDEVATQHGAAPGDSSDVGRYNKVLVARDALKAITKIGNEARDTHYRFTLPWADAGARLLPAAMFDKYTDAMRGLRDDFENEVAKFVQRYPDLMDEARVRLNGLFDSSDYPSPFEIEDKFGFSWEVDPIADSNDFRVALGEEQVARIREDIERRTQQRFDDATANVWQRVHDAVAHIHKRMNEYSGEKGQKLHDSVIGNLRDLVALLPGLNFTDDPKLEKLRQSLEGTLCGIETADLKTNAAARDDAKAKAAALLAHMKGTMQ